MKRSEEQNRKIATDLSRIATDGWFCGKCNKPYTIFQMKAMDFECCEKAGYGRILTEEELKDYEVVAP